MAPSTLGAAYALGGVLLWGFSPLYWKHLRHVPAMETLLHRIVWSAVTLLPLALALGRGAQIRAALAPKGELSRMSATTALIGGNWFIYIWAINHGRLLEASLGYFITPLVSVLLGGIFLGERLRSSQMTAVALATLGVANLVRLHGSLPWVSVLLAASFATYALLRKTAKVDALAGLTVEVILLTPLCAAALLWWGARGESSFFSSPVVPILLIGSSVVTGLPLLLYTEGARRLPLKTLGLLQFVAPTCQFLLGVYAFGEALPQAKLLSFVLIWIGLALYTFDAASSRRRD